jgi:mRNA interferase RelE/StbE
MRKLDPPVRTRIVDALRALAMDPDKTLNVRSLKGRSDARLRVGDWRVIFEADREARKIVIHRVLPRGRAYDR